MKERFETFTVLIASISRSIRRLKTEETAEFNLKSPHVSCLYYLYKEETMTAAELCEVCDEDKAAVSRSLTEMEQRGLLERDMTAGAYRAKLRLTSTGREAADYVRKKACAAVEAAGQDLSDGDRAVLYTALESIAGQLQTIAKEGLPD